MIARNFSDAGSVLVYMRATRFISLVIISAMLAMPSIVWAKCGGHEYALTQPFWSLLPLVAIIILETALLRRTLKTPWLPMVKAVGWANLVTFLIPYVLSALFQSRDEILLMLYCPIESLIRYNISPWLEGQASLLESWAFTLLMVAFYTFSRVLIESWLIGNLLRREGWPKHWSDVAYNVLWINAVAVIVFLLLLAAGALLFQSPQYSDGVPIELLQGVESR